MENKRMKGTCGIYKITNLLNGKVYVGSTGRDLNKRKLEHFNALRSNIHHNRHLQSSYNKYGEDNFEFTVLEQVEIIPDVEKLKKFLLGKEQYWIEKLDCVNKGYNIRKTAESNLGVKLSKEAYDKISKLHKGKVVSKETREKTGKSLKGLFAGEKNPMYGKHHSDKTKLKIGFKNKGRICSEENRNKISNGLKKFYEDKRIKEGKPPKEVKKLSKEELSKKLSIDNSKSKKVQCIETGEVFHSSREADRVKGIHGVRKCCSGERKTVAGLHWKYIP